VNLLIALLQCTIKYIAMIRADIKIEEIIIIKIGRQ
jgi:hypothetical protein